MTILLRSDTNLKTYKVEWSVTVEAEDAKDAYEQGVSRLDRRFEDGDTNWMVRDEDGEDVFFDEETGEEL